MKFTKLFLVLAFALALVFALAPDSVAAGPKGPTIVDVAVYANSPEGPYPGAFDTLIAAVGAADPAVAATLSGNGQHTVFAPTDAAFLAAGFTPENIVDVPEDTLTQILLYHVSSGELMSDDISTGTEVASLQGDSATLEIQGDDILINGATISAPDQAGANGVVHGIDAVLIPPSFGQ